MKGIFGFVGLLIVVAVVGLLAKKQLSVVAPAAQEATSAGVAKPAGSPQQQVRQVQQNVETLMQQPRPDPDATK